MAQLIKVAFGGLTQVGPRNNVLYESPDSPRKWAMLGGCLDHSKSLSPTNSFKAMTDTLSDSF